MAALPAADIRRAVRLGLEEDLADGDVTTSALFSSPTPASAYIIGSTAASWSPVWLPPFRPFWPSIRRSDCRCRGTMVSRLDRVSGCYTSKAMDARSSKLNASP